jgi:hypothetical protein
MDGTFFYFVDESQKDQKGKFLLSRCDDAFPLNLPPHSLFPSHGYVFVIQVTSLRNFLFSAATLDERERWIEAVRRIVREVRGRLREERERKTLHMTGIKRRIEREKMKCLDRSHYAVPLPTARLEKSATDREASEHKKKMSSQKRKALNLEIHSEFGNGVPLDDPDGEGHILDEDGSRRESRHSWHCTRRDGRHESIQRMEWGKGESDQEERVEGVGDMRGRGREEGGRGIQDGSRSHSDFPDSANTTLSSSSSSPSSSFSTSSTSSSSSSSSSYSSSSCSSSSSSSNVAVQSSLKEARTALLFASRAASWSVDDVGVWLASIGEERVSEQFVANCICGADLFELEEEELENDLEITDKAVRKRLLRAIDILRLRYCEVEV